MSLKELTWDAHQRAEATPFMKAVFNKSMPQKVWADWTFQKTLFYGTIEGAAGANRLLGDLPDLRRAFYLYLDFNDMWEDPVRPVYRDAVVDYHNYILSISKDPDKIMAHLYTWHMGDMFGGQMIKKIVPGSHRNLEFEDAAMLKANIRAKLNDSMGEEANVAFEWAIKLMDTYTDELDLANTD
jgi:heme oxygenase